MLVNPNLMNPEIVTRINELRERDLRSQICDLNEIASENEREGVRAPASRPRVTKRRISTALGWVTSLLAR